jgi:hypothetical protein
LKAPSLVYQGRVDHGKLKIFRRAELIHDLTLYFEGFDLDIVFRKHYNRRTIPMNNYYWGVVVPCVRIGLEGVGYLLTHEQVHEMMKEKFARVIVQNRETDDVLDLPGSTAKMTTAEMMEYIALIREWAQEYLGIHIPLPGEQTKFEYGQNTD